MILEWLAAVALSAQDGAALTTSQPPATPEASATPADDTVADVIVSSERREAVTLIDRKVYRVGDDAHAQTSGVLDFLGKLPSVSVSPSGQVTLLGSPGVTILIDGKPQGGSVLRSLTGADIERVEVMTNPSAQFAAEGSGGVINIITKSQRRPGLTGSSSASIDTLGSASVSVSPTLTRGRWIFSSGLTASTDRGRGEGSLSRRLEDEGIVSARTEEDQDSRNDGRNIYARGRAAYRPDDRRTFSASFYLMDWDFRTDGRADVRDLGDPSRNFVRISDETMGWRSGNLDLGYEWTTPEGQSLTASVASTWTGLDNDAHVGGQPSQAYRQLTRTDTVDQEAKLDYTRPLSGDRLLSLGASLNRNARDQDTAFTRDAAGPDVRRQTDGVRSIAAAYATYQFAAGPWTFLPGLRIEHDEVEIGANESRDATDLFPSLHVRREFGSGLKADLSYSRRTDRPGIDNLDHTVIYYDSTQARAGNPDLQPMTTDAYELSLERSFGDHQLSAVLYDRESHDIWSGFSRLLDDGATLATTINAGSSAARGLSLSARGPLSERLKYILSGDLASRSEPVLDGDALATRTNTSYEAKATLEYNRPVAGLQTSEQVQLVLTYYGPRQFLQQSISDFSRLDLTWRRPFSDRTALVFTVQDLLGSSESRDVLRTETLYEARTWRQPGPRLKITLSHRFGAADGAQ